MLFRDTMDHSRIVKPLNQQGRTWTCGIYWLESGRLNYAGTAPIPASLFEDEKTRPVNSRIGFVPYNKDKPEAPQQRERRPLRRRERDDD